MRPRPTTRERGAARERRAAARSRGLSAGYGGVPVVRDLDLDGATPARSSRCSGRTARARRRRCCTLAGASPPIGGEVRWQGDGDHARRCTGGPAAASASSPRSARSSWASRRDENLRLGRGPATTALELFPELRPLLKRRAGLLSGGEQQMLTLARALAAEPRRPARRRALARPRAARRQPPARRCPRRGRRRRRRAARRAARRAGAGDRRPRLRAAPRPRRLQGTAAELSRDFDEIRNSYLTGAPSPFPWRQSHPRTL